MTDWSHEQEVIEAAWADPARRGDLAVSEAVRAAVDALDHGLLRVCEPTGGPGSDWQVHAWVKEAILLFFAIQKSEPIEIGPFHYRDKIPLKRDPELAGIRVVPPAVIRYGAFLERGVVAMPCYVNIGAWVGSGTMIDTWATVGSCAQIGRNVHISGGAGIGGVLEPPQAAPVVIEDACFIGSRCVVVEGVRVEEGAVLGAGVVLTASTPIVDVRGSVPEIRRGRVPPRSVIIPGTLPRKFPAGEYGVPCALLIGERRESTMGKTTLNELLREFPWNREREDLMTDGPTDRADLSISPESLRWWCDPDSLGFESGDRDPRDPGHHRPGPGAGSPAAGLLRAQQGAQRLRLRALRHRADDHGPAPAGDDRHRPPRPQRYRLREQLPLSRHAAGASSCRPDAARPSGATWRSSSMP